MLEIREIYVLCEERSKNLAVEFLEDSYLKERPQLKIISIQSILMIQNMCMTIVMNCSKC